MARMPRLAVLRLAHNRICSLGGLAALQGEGGSLRELDVRNNELASLTELAVLAACPALEALRLGGGSLAGAGNPICGTTDYRAAVAAALPQVQYLDGVRVEADEAAGGRSPEALTQAMASLQLQTFQQEQHLAIPGRHPDACPGGAVPTPCFPRTDLALSIFHGRRKDGLHGRRKSHRDAALRIESGEASAVHKTLQVGALPVGGQLDASPQAMVPDTREVALWGGWPVQGGWCTVPGQLKSRGPAVEVANAAVQADGEEVELAGMRKEMGRLQAELQMMAGELEEHRATESSLQHEALEAVRLAEQSAEERMLDLQQQAAEAVSKASSELESSRELSEQFRREAQQWQQREREAREMLSTCEGKNKNLGEEVISLERRMQEQQAQHGAELDEVRNSALAAEEALKIDCEHARQGLANAQAALEIMGQERSMLESSLHQHGGAVVMLQAEATQAVAGANAQAEALRQQLALAQDEAEALRQQDRASREEAAKAVAALDAAREEHNKAIERLEQQHDAKIQSQVSVATAEGEARARGACAEEVKREKEALHALAGRLEAEFICALKVLRVKQLAYVASNSSVLALERSL
eukprot:evm.model.scf_318.3 EVM.evm.TU.scf_318.3   scf_318:10850-17328(-)